MRQDYIRTAWSKGLNERTVIFRHALKNAMIPIVTIIGLQLGTLLSGAVLPVGGIKEKVLAAHRAGITKVILPKENERDLQDVPADVRGELLFLPVETVDEVLRVALGIDLSRNILINAGNSGGPLLDMAGQVVGINVAIAGNAENIGFAVSANTASRVYNDLLRYGRVIRPYLGATLSDLTPDVASQLGISINRGSWFRMLHLVARWLKQEFKPMMSSWVRQMLATK
jgi:hypothetical protein